jgi:hypothetical protein
MGVRYSDTSVTLVPTSIVCENGFEFAAVSAPHLFMASLWFMRLNMLLLAAFGVLNPSASAQIVFERTPTQIFEESLAQHMSDFGRRVTLAGETIVLGGDELGLLSEGLVAYWTRSVTGYERTWTSWPTACWPGPVGTLNCGYGLTCCLYGLSLSATPDRVAIGSSGSSLFPAGGSRGLVHLLRKDPTGPGWSVEVILRSPINPDPQYFGVGFGSEIALDGETLAVGLATWHASPTAVERGAIQIFERIQGEWTQAAFLTAAPYNGPHVASGSMGNAIAMHEGVLVAAENDRRSRVNIFTRGSSGWGFTQVIERPNPSEIGFGSEIAVDGRAGVLAVAEYGTARVWVYERDPGTGIWNFVTHLSRVGGGQDFPLVVKVRGDLIAASDPRGHSPGGVTGNVQLFRRGPLGWQYERTIAPPDGPQLFGWDFDLRDGRLVVGAPAWGPTPNFWPGRAYLYELSEGTPACNATGAADLHALFDDDVRDRVHLSVLGLTGPGVGYFVAGDPGTGHVLGNGTLCVDHARRVSGPLGFGNGIDRLYATARHPDPSAPNGTAYQFVFVERGVTPRYGTSIARFVD